jgi:hypothetical protein
MLDIKLYNQFLQQYISEAIRNSDGSNRSIAEYLETIRVSGWFVRNKVEKRQALADARAAFDKNRHWPLEIILSHLGVKHPDHS